MAKGRLWVSSNTEYPFPAAKDRWVGPAGDAGARQPGRDQDPGGHRWRRPGRQGDRFCRRPEHSDRGAAVQKRLHRLEHSEHLVFRRHRRRRKMRRAEDPLWPARVRKGHARQHRQSAAGAGRLGLRHPRVQQRLALRGAAGKPRHSRRSRPRPANRPPAIRRPICRASNSTGGTRSNCNRAMSFASNPTARRWKSGPGARSIPSV